MTRIIVLAGPTTFPDAPILLDERVCSAHLSDEHCAAQLIERLGWAITDAEEAELAEPDQQPGGRRFHVELDADRG